MNLRKIAPVALGLTALFGLTACAPGADQAGSGASGDITLRLWDEKAAEAYETSIEQFEAANPGIQVEVNVVPWDDYFNTLRNDVGSGSADDIFWLNGAYYEDYATNGHLLAIDETLGADAEKGWNESVVKQYTKDDHLWGVPQLTDGGSAIYYNDEALKAAGVTPEEISKATWNPSDPTKDTFLPILQKLTIDANGKNALDPAFDASNIKQYGFNAGQDLQNIMLNFIGSNGGSFQDENAKLTFTDPKTVEAFTYLVKLINEYHVAPPASSTNDDGDFTRDEFLAGNIALFESGTYNLANVQEGASFTWGVTEMPAGPEGKVTAAPGIIAAANANAKNPQAVKAFLSWIGSAEGNKAFGESGTAVPAVTDARASYDSYWQQQGVDVKPFFTVIENDAKTLPPVIGQNFGAMLDAYKPSLNDVFLGKVAPADGLKQAEEKGNAAAK